MGARNRVGIGLSYRPAARLHRLACVNSSHQSMFLSTFLADEEQRDEGKEYRFFMSSLVHCIISRIL